MIILIGILNVFAIIILLIDAIPVRRHVRHGHCPVCGVPTTYERISVDEQTAGHAQPVCAWFRLRSKHLQGLKEKR